MAGGTRACDRRSRSSAERDPPSALHTYLAEELFQGAPEELQDNLVRLALLPTLDQELITDYIEGDAGRLVQEARDLGFLAGDDAPTLHPLVRGFLLEKLAERPDARAQVDEAVQCCIREHQWGWRWTSLALRVRRPY